MKKRTVAFLLGVCMVMLNILPAEAQNVDRLILRAEQLLRLRNYSDALENYQKALEAGGDLPRVHYGIGVCYILSTNANDHAKAIPELENALANRDKDVPSEVYFYLGKSYHINNQIAKAIEAYEKYQDEGREPNMLKDTERQLIICENAATILEAPKSIDVFRFGDNINSGTTEYNPVVSADESVMAFTAFRSPTGRPDDAVESILVTYQNNGSWSTPVELEIQAASNANVGTAGISADGLQMLIFLSGANNSGSIYSVHKSGDHWGAPESLGNEINSRYLETTASLTPDGQTIFFASNRPGGHGGMDIYMSERDKDGNWLPAINLGPGVNSEFDEDAPFIHPDGHTLFFTSDGHTTIGGRDIFKTYKAGGEWAIPENMGYPINTTSNDNYFTLTADGSKGYFSSDRPGGAGGQDIYYLNMPENETNVPLTMVTGRIIGEDGTSVGARIKVVDNETSEKVKYVYDPDPETGDYLIIFPPGKNYDMIITAEGYLPYTVNINIPNQQYFYRLYQQIVLVAVKQFDEVVGQGVEVRNAFYDTDNTDPNDPQKTRDRLLVQNDSVDLYEMMDLIVASSDEVAYDYLLDLLYESSPIDSIDFDETGNESIEAATTVYYYEENPEDALEMRIIDGDTILSLPTFYVTEVAEQQKAEREAAANSAASYDPTLLGKVVKVYFNSGASELDEEYHSQLDQLLLDVQNVKELGVEISGYASSEGDPEFNRKLSNERAIGVLDYLNGRGLPRRKVIARGYGATSDSGGSARESRRVEVKIVDISGL
ncbi:MAG TPA: hypothetical protein DCE41_18370 [Cytophagales bacterium]|nr:hypothetical protein [Cytophagales bacterium]HAA19506.1 hypothetical protein [Cytophagales bacterium]HAP59620.1 hypothetical protein [Cytophagales bacterium]